MLRRHADFVGTRLQGCSLDARQRFAQMPPVIFERNEQVGLDCNDEVTIALIEIGAGASEHPEAQRHERQRESLVTAE